MIFSKAVVSVLCIILLFSIFMANLLNTITTDHNIYTEDQNYGIDHTKRLEDKYGDITDTSKNLIWFLQISDIHISIFRDPDRLTDFRHFCENTVKKISPLLVLATGDLTDAKAKDNLGSVQIKSEWVNYYKVIKESGVTDVTTWLDIRGNHDNFNIVNINSQENYFRNYSVQGHDNPKSYLHIVNKNGVKAAFLGIDACPDPGLRRPFNFIGILDVQEQNHIKKLKLEAESNADHIIWFGHYPTSCILSVINNSEKIIVRNLIGKTIASQVYLCGHLHAMGGLVPQMYTKQKTGYLEIELGDWKDNRIFRLGAIDHGLFSFVDQKHNRWPVVLVTNPKHARFLLPGREPLKLMSESTHIRILAFSDVDIKTVNVSLNKKDWVKCSQSEGPLYVCEWSPSDYLNGLHYLHVVATDVVGKETIVNHPFAMGNHYVKDHFDFFSRIFLMLKAEVAFQAIFGSLLMINILPLVILRLQKRPPRYQRKFSYTSILMRRLWLLSKINKVFYPIILYAVYLPFGPWAFGELIDGCFGTIFAWGIIIRGNYIPEPFTYMYGSVQLMFVQIPLIYVLANTIAMRLSAHNLYGIRKLMKHMPFILLLTIQFLLAYFFWLEYGTMCFIFGPLRTWSIPLSLGLWYKVLNLPTDYCSKLRKLNEMPS